MSNSVRLGSYLPRFVNWTFISVAMLLAVPVLVTSGPEKIRFNQMMIDSIDSSRQRIDLQEQITRWASSYSSRVNSLLFRDSNLPDYDNPGDVLRFVFSQLPYFAIVHPSEAYYYFSFNLPNRAVSGNLRLVEIDRGILSLGYFSSDDKKAPARHQLFTQKEGLHTNISGETVELSYQGKTVYMRLPHTTQIAPPTLALLQGEQFVSTVRDESGIEFFLIFNETTRSFYYLLDNRRPLGEDLDSTNAPLLIGTTTHFAYLQNGDRILLIAVRSGSVSANDYYDGPFDQVPPRLYLRDKLYQAYPYLQAGGTDEHGNLCTTKGVRAAISPYSRYEITDDLKSLLEICAPLAGEGVRYYACLTREQKSVLHRESPMFLNNGSMVDSSMVRYCTNEQVQALNDPMPLKVCS